MSENQNGFGNQLDLIIKTLSLSAKIGLLIGGGCIVVYSLINGHYPQGVSIGDGLLFLISALCFGGIYLIFTGLITATGVLLSPVLIPALRLYLRTTEKLSKEKSSLIFEYQKINLATVLFGLSGAIFIYALSRNNLVEHIPLMITPLFQYIMYSTLLDHNKKIKSSIINSKKPKIEHAQKESQTVDIEWLKKTRAMTIGVLIVTPLCFGGITTDLLQTAMTIANVRIEKAVIHVKPPYSSLLPGQTDSKLENYKRFENATIIFRGVGNTTLVEIQSEDSSTRLEVPNNSIIIERNKKTSQKLPKMNNDLRKRSSGQES
ncbi:hypothetical protein ACOI7N_00010 [Pseudomonas sp. P2758]|uniref:hypothetical protein n=1 Tax=Pseudomonas sp. P2758 TaxID=3409916 RepID=UPI003B5BF488